MKGCLRVVRGNEVMLTLPGPSITVKSDGTLWASNNPILGIEDETEKARVATLARAKKFDQIPTIYFTRLGNNPNGLWAGTDDMWGGHPLKVEEERLSAAERAEAAKQVTIYLSSRGWGDYPNCEWHGDITRSDAAILIECRALLENGYDVDQTNQSDEELINKIAEAREDWKSAPSRKQARETAEKEDIRRKIANGYCFACESYCYGDCGYYSNDPTLKFKRDIKQAATEAQYGINEG